MWLHIHPEQRISKPVFQGLLSLGVRARQSLMPRSNSNANSLNRNKIRPTDEKFMATEIYLALTDINDKSVTSEIEYFVVRNLSLCNIVMRKGPNTKILTEKKNLRRN